MQVDSSSTRQAGETLMSAVLELQLTNPVDAVYDGAKSAHTAGW